MLAPVLGFFVVVFLVVFSVVVFLVVSLLRTHFSCGRSKEKSLS
jgi:hypothetical protein